MKDKSEKQLVAASLLILSFFTLSTHAIGPTYEVISNNSIPNLAVELYANGLYYLSPSLIYNATSSQIFTVRMPEFCSVSPLFTPQAIPWCYGSVSNTNGTITFEVYYLNAYLNESMATLVIGTYSNNSELNYEYTNGFLVFIISGIQTAANNYTVAIYDLESMQQVCPKATVDNNSINSIYTDGKIFLSGYIDDDNNSQFTLLNCSTGQTYVSSGISEYSEIDLYGFNNSAVFINLYGTSTSYKIQPAAFDSSNVLKFGSSIGVSAFFPYNSTHFFMGYTPNGKYTYGLFVITAELEILEVFSFDLVFAYFDFLAYPVYGTSWITFNMINYIVTYDVNYGILNVDSIIPPIILTNGSIVKMTQFGYFIQSPGQPYYFIQAPFSNNINAIYQDPTDFNQYYTLFVPSTSDPSFNKCLLTHFNVTSSQITQSLFPNCPLTIKTSNTITMKDVQYDANGNPHVVYRDSYGSVVVINPAGSNGPFKSTYLYTSIQLGLNLTNGTINFVGFQLTSFVAGRISLTTGEVLVSHTFPSGRQYATIIKITAQYYGLIYTETNTKFEIVDAVNLVKVFNVTSNLQFIFNHVPAFVLGFNPLAPTNFSGVVLWTAENIYLMNNWGETSVIDPGSFTIFDVVPLNQNQFFTSHNENYLMSEALYEINSWGYNSTERSEYKDIEV